LRFFIGCQILGKGIEIIPIFVAKSKNQRSKTSI